jgi:hypothetical protein
MVKRFVCVSPKDRTKAQAMAHDHMEETRLFYQL